MIGRVQSCLLFSLLLACCLNASSQTATNCGQQAVLYKPFDPRFAKQIQLKPLEKSYEDPADSDKQLSPQQTRWFVETEPDYTKPAPWNTSIVISAGPKGKAFRLDVLDHSNGSVAVHWLNEKLLFIQVWWGRVASTDMVFDASTGRFPYREMANYDETMNPCE